MQSNTSLIILNKEGFTYANNIKTEFIPKSILPFSVVKKTNRWISDNISTEDKIEIIIANNSSLFIPKILFDNNFKQSYYEKNDKIADTDKLLSDTSDNLLNEIIYKIPIKTDIFLNNLSNEFNIKHLNTIIYNFLIRNNKGNLNNKLYVNISEDFFNIFLFCGQDLHLINSYENKGVDSFLYYLFYIIEKKQLNKNEFIISFLGKYNSFKKFYEDTLMYHQNIEFIFSDNKKNISGINPFIIDYYENYIWNS